MSVTDTTITIAPEQKKSKFWMKRSTTSQSIDTAMPATKKTGPKMPTLFVPPILNHGRRSSKIAQLYKLSTINDSGIYMPPSPTEDKIDQWDNIGEGYFEFHPPSPDRLTVQHAANKNSQFNFYTPSMVAFHANQAKRMTWAGPATQSDTTSEDDDQSICSLPTEATTPVDASMVVDKKDSSFVPKFSQWEEATLVTA
ncbi:hypothetical protein BGW37DRAFT_491718 [Umbelopsis sp. PMI_123]|nr:hypothetical protein BGW37DRAFT_491718 [Umbelopsis sp. PMI_123]